MLGLALEQALSFSDALGEDRDPLEWAAQRDAARDWLESAWNETRQAFPAWLGADEVDASMLLFVVNGFLEPDDPRARMVVETVESELGRNGFLARWSGSKDGAFLLCSCWLAQALVELGELDRAQDVLERVVACGNDVGLLPEEIDAATGEALGKRAPRHLARRSRRRRDGDPDRFGRWSHGKGKGRADDRRRDHGWDVRRREGRMSGFRAERRLSRRPRSGTRGPRRDP